MESTEYFHRVVLNNSRKFCRFSYEQFRRFLMNSVTYSSGNLVILKVIQTSNFHKKINIFKIFHFEPKKNIFTNMFMVASPSRENIVAAAAERRKKKLKNIDFESCCSDLRLKKCSFWASEACLSFYRTYLMRGLGKIWNKNMRTHSSYNV